MLDRKADHSPEQPSAQETTASSYNPRERLTELSLAVGTTLLGVGGGILISQGLMPGGDIEFMAKVGTVFFVGTGGVWTTDCLRSVLRSKEAAVSEFKTNLRSIHLTH